MTPDLNILIISALSIGFLHTLLGPDHYIPFIMLAKAQKWSGKKTAWVVAACGIGHVGSSILLGAVGIALGMALSKLTGIEAMRGGLAAWLLIGFGLAYSVWALLRLARGKSHTHTHVHTDGTIHSHRHSHHQEHMHPHQEQNTSSITPWILFIIFIFGPCEPLIPLLMYPAAVHGIWQMALVALAFAIATIGTMLAAVLFAHRGIELISWKRFEKYTHLVAGLTILISGLGIEFLGL